MNGIRKRIFGGRSRRVNVMTPLNWMCLVSEGILVPVGGWHGSGWLAAGCFSLAVIIVIFYGCMYVYFALKDPDRLQSEEFNLPLEHPLTTKG